MSIQFKPTKGSILMCDFSRGFVEPEMVKIRPVIVLKANSRSRLVTVIPLSTMEPNPVQDYHLEIPMKELPNYAYFNSKTSWLKGDMIYTVSWRRLSPIRVNKKSRTRTYHKGRVSLDLLTKIEICVINGIGLKRLIRTP